TPANQATGGPTASSAATGGWGIAAYLDEYGAADHLQGKVLLKGGITRAPEDPNQSRPVDWRYMDGSTLLGMPEANAIAAVQAALQPPSSRAGSSLGEEPVHNLQGDREGRTLE